MSNQQTEPRKLPKLRDVGDGTAKPKAQPAPFELPNEPRRSVVWSDEEAARRADSFIDDTLKLVAERARL